MLNKPLDNVTSEDIENLVVNSVLERRTLEYKAELPNNSDAGKKEFLADVSSFANTIGGDLIFGIKESSGIIDSEYELAIANPDTEIARLENIIRDGIAPRIKVETTTISLSENKAVLIVRIRTGMESPHRVIYKAHDKFYARTSNGKYPMDVLELRTAFAQTSAVIDRIKDFRINRVLQIKSSENSSSSTDIPFFAIHILPLSAFNSSFRMDADQLLAVRESRIEPALQPFRTGGGWNQRINLLGAMAYSAPGNQTIIPTYTQLYREGIVESVDKEILTGRGEKKLLPMYALEDAIMKFATRNLQLLANLNFQSPFYIFLSFVNIQGFSVIIPERFWRTDAEPITANELLLPEIVIENINNIEQHFRSTFDMIWNAAGIERSLNFDENDSFVKR